MKKNIVALTLILVIPMSLLLNGCQTDPAIVAFNRGTALGDKGNFDRAIAELTKAIEINPRYAEAYCYRATAWAEEGEYDQALEDYTKAIEIDPLNISSYGGRGKVWLKKGDYERAIDNFNKFIEIATEKGLGSHRLLAVVYSDRGEAWLKKGEYDKAIEDCTKAIKLNPRHPEAYGNRGMAFFEKWKAASGLKKDSFYDKSMEDLDKGTKLLEEMSK